MTTVLSCNRIRLPLQYRRGGWGELEGMFEKASYWYKTKCSGKVTCTWGFNSLKSTPCWQVRKDISRDRKPKQSRTELLDAENDGIVEHPTFSFAAVFCITDTNLKAYSGRDVHLCNCWTVYHSCCVGVQCSFIPNFCSILCVCVCLSARLFQFCTLSICTELWKPCHQSVLNRWAVPEYYNRNSAIVAVWHSDAKRH